MLSSETHTSIGTYTIVYMQTLVWVTGLHAAQSYSARNRVLRSVTSEPHRHKTHKQGVGAKVWCDMRITQAS